MYFNFTEGSYNLSLFSIYVDTDHSFAELKDLPPEVLAAFYHEYFHFLQDVTSPFTVNVMWQLYGSTVQLIQYAQTHGSVIRLPLGEVAELKYLERQKRFIDLIFGGQYCGFDNEPAAVPYEVVQVKIEARTDFSDISESENVKFVELEIADANGQKSEYGFGALAVIETMTYLIQKKFFGESAVPEVPYIIAVRVAALICPGIGSNEEYVFSVCDLALKTPYPGWMFVFLLTELGKAMPDPKSASAIYEFCLPILEEMWRCQESFAHYKKKVLHCLGQLQGHAAFIDNLNWITTLIEQGYNRQTNEPMMMLKLYQQEKPFNEYLLGFRDDLGMPEIINNLRNRWFHVPASLQNTAGGIDPTILGAAIQLHATLLEADTCCALQPQCAKSHRKMPLDTDCSTAPWKKAHLDPSCAFGAIWASFGLHNFTIEQDEWILEEMEIVTNNETVNKLWIRGYPNNQWVDAPFGNYKVRVDPAGPAGQIHIHISHPQHRQSKKEQVSWNIDGTRHDAGSFNENFVGMKQARRIAREVLRIPDNVVLQYKTRLAYTQTLLKEGDFPLDIISCKITPLTKEVRPEDVEAGL
ncbi:DUF6367 family protein [Chitinophaga sancti]|uniref:DUF6367 family protein n=1 Tax=Chitinophaga sancti TaxID=1004 RepID=UPI002A747D80|nr:DUF6367 family protein [Chitinophaga sancti]WPQ65208.1 DUF6367 family protein [Chitinophaga sancti]